MAFDRLNFEVPFVTRDVGTLSLHFTVGEVQSSMHADRPDDLAIDYTRTMMGFLLLCPDPRHVTMIGLGGGSLAKFCLRHLPLCRVTAVENNPGVIALREQFSIPGDGPRMAVVADDGAAFMRRTRETSDVVLVDAFDQRGQPEHLCTRAFYDDCRRALAPGGVFAVNLHVDDAGCEPAMHRIAASFGGNAMQVTARGQRNCIVFAARDRPVTLEALRGDGWTAALSPAAGRQLKADFDHIGWHACALPSRR